MNKSKVSVVIPTLDKEEVTRTLKHIENQIYDGEIETIVVNEPELDIAEARNKGIRKASGEIIAFTNDDCYPKKDWIKEATKHFDNSEIGGVEGYTYGGLERIVSWGYMTSNIFYKKEVLEEVGGLDTELSRWRDDTDIGWRILKQGYKITYESKARVEHPSTSNSEIQLDKKVRLFKKHPKKYLENGVFYLTIKGILCQFTKWRY